MPAGAIGVLHVFAFHRRLCSRNKSIELLRLVRPKKRGNTWHEDAFFSGASTSDSHFNVEPFNHAAPAPSRSQPPPRGRCRCRSERCCTICYRIDAALGIRFDREREGCHIRTRHALGGASHLGVLSRKLFALAARLMHRSRDAGCTQRQGFIFADD